MPLDVEGHMVYLARGRRLARLLLFLCWSVGSEPVASYRFSRYVLLRPMILKRYVTDGHTIKKGWSYQGKLIFPLIISKVKDSSTVIVDIPPLVSV